MNHNVSNNTSTRLRRQHTCWLNRALAFDPGLRLPPPTGCVLDTELEMTWCKSLPCQIQLSKGASGASALKQLCSLQLHSRELWSCTRFKGGTSATAGDTRVLLWCTHHLVRILLDKKAVLLLAARNERETCLRCTNRQHAGGSNSRSAVSPPISQLLTPKSLSPPSTGCCCFLHFSCLLQTPFAFVCSAPV